MRKLLLLTVLSFITTVSFSQHVEDTLPTTYWCPNDTFKLRFKDAPDLTVFTASRTDKMSPGTDAYPDEYAVLYYGNDSLRLNYHNNLPYQHNIYVNFASPKGKTTLRFHFNYRTGHFSTEYIARYNDKVRYDIPEVYELANIIWALSPPGQRATDLHKTGDYYQRVVKYSKPWMDHPVFRQLNFPDSVAPMQYFNFRENSFAFNIDEKAAKGRLKLLFNGPYYYVFGNELADSSLFGKLKPLVEDFANVSNFRKFYRDNKKFYDQQVARAEQLLPMRTMWQWLEKQFPDNKYQSYRLVFSPLIGGSHSTQRYGTWYDNVRFGESVMFVCGPERYDSSKTWSEKQKEGLYSGVVFTEIDHNYVNPATSKYAKKVDSIFSKRAVWTRQGSSSGFYGNAISVFNEYMTHAAFCAYVEDLYDPAIAAFVIGKREDLMVDRRGFTRFREFNQELLRLYRQNKDKPLVTVYPALLDWCAKQQ